MDGKSEALSNSLLDHALGGGDYTRPASVYLAAFDEAGDEFDGGGYARAEIENNDTNFPAASSRTKSNGTVIQLGPASGPWPDCYRVKLFDAETDGNVMYSSFLGSDYGKPFTAIASGDVITVPGHSLQVGDRAVILSADGATLPTGLTDELLVYVKTVSGNDLTVSLTEGGGAIDLESAGAGIIKKVTPQPGVVENGRLEFAIGELQFREA